MIGTDPRFITSTLRDLVAIPSINPSLDADGTGEARIAAHVATLLGSLGLDVAVHETEPGRPSVVGRLRGTGGGRSLMLNAHVDTVGVEGMADPFGATIRDGRLHGRGAYDMKGSLAACIGAAEALVRSGVRLAGDLLIAAVADEEHASIGTQDVVARYPVDGAIVTEPTSLRLCVAHKGFVWFDVVTSGRAAHGSRPDLGIDANALMGRVLARVEALNGELATRPPHPLLGSASLHCAVLRGGTGLSTYAAECHLGLERRTIPGETVAQTEAEIEAILNELRSADPSFRATLRTTLSRPSFEARADSALVRLLFDRLGSELATAPELVGETPWMDASLLAEAGVDTVVVGPHGEGAHAAVEWVDLESVDRLARVLASTAREYCAA